MNINGMLGRGDIPDIRTVLLIFLSVILYPAFLVFFLPEPFSPDNVNSFLLRSIFHTSILTFFLLFLLFSRFRQYIFSVLDRPSVYIFKGFFAYLAFIPLMVPITLFTGYFLKAVGIQPSLQEIVRLYMDSDSGGVLTLVFISSCIIAPFAEEVIYRGIVYRAMKGRFPVSVSIILSAAFFALIHMELSNLPALFFLGLALAWLFEKHGNLWPSIGLHFFNNFFANMALLLLKTTDLVNLESLNL